MTDLEKLKAELDAAYDAAITAYLAAIAAYIAGLASLDAAVAAQEKETDQ
jgi:hypothetical protein